MPKAELPLPANGSAISNPVAGCVFKSVKSVVCYDLLTNRFPEIRDSAAASRSLPAFVFTT